jgi:hypothetical protein
MKMKSKLIALGVMCVQITATLGNELENSDDVSRIG